MQVYERLDELGADCAEVKASSLLRGLAGVDTLSPREVRRQRR